LISFATVATAAEIEVNGGEVMHWIILFTACISGNPTFSDHFGSIRCMQYPSLITYEGRQGCVKGIDESGPPAEGIDKSVLAVLALTAPGFCTQSAARRSSARIARMFSKSAHAWCLRTFEFNTDFTEHCGKDTPRFPMLCANKIAPTNSYKNV
jgi:hypothetical protein